MGSSFHFPRQVPLGIASEYLLTGETMEARQPTAGVLSTTSFLKNS